MLIADRVRRALDASGTALQETARESRKLRDRYVTALEEMSGLTSTEIAARLAGHEWPGARPAESPSGDFVRPFPHRFRTAHEARQWALTTLEGVTTLAVDGSQIAASKEFGVPVSLVQVAWFQNPHTAGRPYVKDLVDEVVAAEPEDEYPFLDSRLNQRRFALEMEVATIRLAALRSNEAPVLLIDGTFVLSFLRRMVPPVQDGYLQPLFSLLRASQRHRVPVVGYVDLSFATDLAGLLRTLFDLPPGPVYDAQIVRDLGPLDRTAAFACARGDVLPLYRTAGDDLSQDLLFLYLQTGAERPPARLDVPRWVLDAGLLERVVDVVRAEVIVGGGYPYAIETADAAAVLTVQDRMRFYRLFHDVAAQYGLDATLPAKSISKRHRR